MATTKRERKWLSPSKRAKGYAQELKAGVHMFGKKKGEQLTDQEIRDRKTYFFCQSDHAGQHRYFEAKNAGLTKQEAAKYSREIGTKLKGGKKNG